jgi:hypothetical protein
MAEYDLRVLSQNIFRTLGAEMTLSLLKEYGLCDPRADALLKCLQQNRISKHTRNRIRFEFGLRLRLNAVGTRVMKERRVRHMSDTWMSLSQQNSYSRSV